MPQVWNRHPSVADTVDFLDHITVEPRWDGVSPDAAESPCFSSDASLSILAPKNARVAVVSCPFNRDADRHWRKGSLQPQDFVRTSFPGFFITVNFTGLLPPVGSTKRPASVHIFPGMSPNFDAVVGNTQPTYLFPGSNVLGVVGVAVRQTLAPSPLGFLGFEVSQT